MSRHSTTDDRAVSTTLGYVLALGVASLLITGLLLGAGGFLENQREETIRTELSVIGEQLAADIESADRLAQTGNTDWVVVRQTLPEDVAGSAYTVTVVGGADPYLVLRSADPEVTVEVDFQTRTSLFDPQQSVDGGKVRIVFDDTDRDGDSEVDLEVERD